MTVKELAQRDYKKAKLNYLRAKNKLNVSKEEVNNLENIVQLRSKILKIVQSEEVDTNGSQ